MCRKIDGMFPNHRCCSTCGSSAFLATHSRVVLYLFIYLIIKISLRCRLLWWNEWILAVQSTCLSAHSSLGMGQPSGSVEWDIQGSSFTSSPTRWRHCLLEHVRFAASLRQRQTLPGKLRHRVVDVGKEPVLKWKLCYEQFPHVLIKTTRNSKHLLH